MWLAMSRGFSSASSTASPTGCRCCSAHAVHRYRCYGASSTTKCSSVPIVAKASRPLGSVFAHGADFIAVGLPPVVGGLRMSCCRLASHCRQGLSLSVGLPVTARWRHQGACCGCVLLLGMSLCCGDDPHQLQSSRFMLAGLSRGVCSNLSPRGVWPWRCRGGPGSRRCLLACRSALRHDGRSNGFVPFGQLGGQLCARQCRVICLGALGGSFRTDGWCMNRAFCGLAWSLGRMPFYGDMLLDDRNGCFVLGELQKTPCAAVLPPGISPRSSYASLRKRGSCTCR
mmetsp:Transcript_102641/g.328893  ORF Transcript_102641/g.328893 Transcript_102641/m.328893 type:complete len:285 (+) Transcript_102641:599-1453(+)